MQEVTRGRWLTLKRAERPPAGITPYGTAESFTLNECVTASVAPEPAALLLVGFALGGLGTLRLRRRVEDHESP